jgi:hypothetical protein
MFVYIWKHNDTPFYIGMSNSRRRTDPTVSNPRGWFCKQKLAEIGAKNVVVEIHTKDTVEEAQLLERSLIEKYGRIQLNTGTLTNLRRGGEGRKNMSEKEKTALSKRMKENNPSHNPETRAKITARMNDPDVKAKFAGDNNPAKRPEVKAKIRAKWAEPGYKEAMIAKRKGKPIHSNIEKEKRRQVLLDPTHPIHAFNKTLNSDPDIKAKRVATLRSPEVQARISASLKLAWAKRKGLTGLP